MLRLKAAEELIEWVHIPVQAILSRLPCNGSLANILNIQNKRFHQANVLGRLSILTKLFSSGSKQFYISFILQAKL